MTSASRYSDLLYILFCNSQRGRLRVARVAWCAFGCRLTQIRAATGDGSFEITGFAPQSAHAHTHADHSLATLETKVHVQHSTLRRTLFSPFAPWTQIGSSASR